MKNNKIINIFLVVLLLLILLFASYFIYEMGMRYSSREEEKEYTLNVYERSDGFICLVKEPDYMCSNLAFSIEVESSEASILKVSSNNSFILYRDNGLKIYNIDKKIKNVINLEDIYDSYEFHLNNDLDEVKGLIYKDANNMTGYYSILNNTKLYDLKYENLVARDENYLEAYDGTNNYLVNANLEKEELAYIKEDELDCGVYYEVLEYNNKYFFLEREGCMSDSIHKIYNHTKQVIYQEIEYYNIDFYEGMLYLNDKNIVKKYDTSGNLLSTSKNLENIISMINNYAIFIENNELSLYNVDTKDIKVITNWSSNYTYDYYTSGFYSKDQLELMEESEKQEGLYVVIMYQEPASNGYYGMEYCYNLENKEIINYPITELESGRAKPVLYLYPEEKTHVKVTFSNPSYLTTTYPKYENGFEIVAYPNGDLYDKNNKYYYALYWDEIRYHEVDFSEGFYVEGDKAIEFLEEKLSIIGLNDRERNEFIMYWLPILESNKKSLVYFELTEERNKNNPIKIEPNPDSMLRISIHVKKVDSFINIKAQKLKSFNRYGFTAVEWGGMTY